MSAFGYAGYKYTKNDLSNEASERTIAAASTAAGNHCDSGQGNVLVMLKRNINMRVKVENKAYKILKAPLGSVISINCNSEQVLNFDGTKYSAVSIEPVYFPPTIYGASPYADGVSKVNPIIKIDTIRDLMLDIGQNYSISSEKPQENKYKLWGSVNHIANAGWTIALEKRQDFVKTVLLNGLLFDPEFESAGSKGFKAVESKSLIAARCWAANVMFDENSNDPRVEELRYSGNYHSVVDKFKAWESSAENVCWEWKNEIPALIKDLPTNFKDSEIINKLVFSHSDFSMALSVAFTEMHPMINGLVDFMKMQSNRVYDYRSHWIGFHENWQIPIATPANKWFARSKERANAAEDLQKKRYMKCGGKSGMSLHNKRQGLANKQRLCKRTDKSVYRCLMYVRKGFEAMGLIPKDTRLGVKAKDVKENIIKGFKKINNLSPDDKVIIDMLDPNDSAYSPELARMVKEEYVKKSNGTYKTTWDKVRGTERIRVPGNVGNRCLFPKGTVMVYKSLTSKTGAGHVEIKTTPSADDDKCEFISDFVADGKHVQRELTSAFIFDPKVLDLVEQKVSSEQPGSRKASQYAERIKDMYIYRSL